MADVRVPGDAVPPVKAKLAAHFGATMRIADEFPDPQGQEPWTVDSPTPLLVVSDDSGPTMWPVWSEPLIRGTVYAKGLQTAKLLRRRAIGALFDGPVGDLYIDRNRIGYVDARDPNSGADMASFTVTATVRTEIITV
jgi:hypothetical protein